MAVRSKDGVNGVDGLNAGGVTLSSDGCMRMSGPYGQCSELV